MTRRGRVRWGRVAIVVIRVGVRRAMCQGSGATRRSSLGNTGEVTKALWIWAQRPETNGVELDGRRRWLTVNWPNRNLADGTSQASARIGVVLFRVGLVVVQADGGRTAGRGWGGAFVYETTWRESPSRTRG